MHGAPEAYAVTLAATAATAAGKQNDGNDDEPKSAVVKQIAEAVIHNRSSKKITEMAIKLPLCYHIMTNEKKGARIWSKVGERGFFLPQAEKAGTIFTIM